MHELDTLHPDLRALLGTAIDRYRVDALLGRGGRGAVFRAHHLGLGRDVALKVVHPELARNPSTPKRFKIEAQSISRLDHPNCVRVIDFGTTKSGVMYLVMELLEGAELRVSLGQPWPPARAVDVIVQILEGIEHAHKFSVVHRDLKPENVFVTRDHHGRELIKLIDFGFAKLIDEQSATETQTPFGVPFGTPRYMSPEQASGDTPDERTDLYAAGVILFELLTGSPPFVSKDPGAVLEMQISATPPALPPSVPASLVAVVDRLLQKSRHHRYASASETIAALKQLRPSLADVSPPLIPEQPRSPLPPPIKVEPAEVPNRLDHYQILGEIGRGGTGVVYAAHDVRLDRKVALKQLHAQGEASLRGRLIREALAMAKLSHPNVIPIYEIGERGDTTFIVMEYVEGSTLRPWLETSRSLAEVLGVFKAAARGLIAAHQKGLVHRDFKPDNVMIGDDGRVRVMDFGLARTRAEPIDADLDLVSATEASPVQTAALGTLTRSGTLLGTVPYASPEQLLLRPAEAASDQFSFCVALYEALHGERPFGGETLEQLREAVVHGHIREPPSNATVPSWLRTLVCRGLALEPQQRFESMQVLLDAIIEGELANQADTRPPPEYVFVAHSNLDKPVVLRLCETLLDHGVRAWLDMWELTPDQDSREPLTTALDKAPAVIVCHGPSGWDATKHEYARVLAARIKRDPSTVYRVGLPGSGPCGSLPVGDGCKGVDLHDASWDDGVIELARLVGIDRDRTDWLAREAAWAGVPPRELSPYRGLEAFREHDARWMFGREREVGELLDLIRADQIRFLTVIGASGSGKSSLLTGGVCPALRHGVLGDERDWHIAYLRPGPPHLLKQSPPERPVLFLVTDGEETALLGAQAFADQKMYGHEIGRIINLEARGNRGPAMMFETSHPNSNVVLDWASGARRPVSNSLMTAVYELLPNSTDLTVYLRDGGQGINIAIADGFDFYHTEHDDLVHLDPRSVQHMGDQALAATRAFLSATDRPAGEIVYADIITRLFVSVPQMIGMLLLGLCFGVSALLFMRPARDADWKRPDWRALAAPPAAIVAAGLFAFASSWLIGFIRPEPAFWTAYPQALNSVFLIGSMIAAALGLAFFAKNSRRETLFASGWMWFLAIGMGLTFAVPGMAMIFLIPAAAFVLAAVVAWLVPAAALIAHAAAALVLALIFFPLIHLVDVMMTLQLAAAFGVLEGLVLAPMLSLVGPLPQGRRLTFAALGAAFIVAFGATALLPAYSADRPLHLNLLAHYDVDARKAQLYASAAPGALPPAVRDQLTVGDATLPGVTARLASRPLDFIDRPHANAAVVNRTSAPDGTIVATLQLSAPGAQVIRLRIPAAANPTQLSYAGKEVAMREAQAGYFTVDCNGRSCDGAQLSFTLKPGALPADPPQWIIQGYWPGLPPDAAATADARDDAALRYQMGDVTVTTRRLTR